MEPIARIEAALAQLGADHRPPAGWEARVLAQTARMSRWRRLLRWRIAMPLVAAGAVAAIVVAVFPRQRELALELAYRSSGVVRGSSHAVGDIVRATASGGQGHRALGVLRGSPRAGVPGRARLPELRRCHDRGAHTAGSRSLHDRRAHRERGAIDVGRDLR
jgi:hypothetical protein